MINNDRGQSLICKYVWVIETIHRAKKFFDDCFGIIADQRIEPQTVKLKVSAGQANYIRDLMLHESQDEIERNEEYSIFKYHLRPTFDFMQEILWNGENMEVLEPQSLRKEMAGIINRMNNKNMVC